MARKTIPAADSIINNELEKVIADLEKKLLVRKECLAVFNTLPESGLSMERIEELMVVHEELDKDVDIEGGKVSGTVYGMDPSLRHVMLRAFSRFFYSNPLHPEVFKAGRKMEAEVVFMTLSLFSGTEECVGTVTSGGTESILLACKAYRDRGRSEKGILFPEIVAPITVHAAFEKAANYFGIRLIHVDVDLETGKADLIQMRRLITGNTVALVGSAPCYSLGIMDDIPAISALAQEYGIGCHVDCCLGSFIIPFMRDLYDLPLFDFAVPGVTSISCDPHKYGFAPKGISVIMYNSATLRQYQYFVSAEWTGGIYATPTLLGSRSGAIVAATWAALLAFGKDGYRDAALRIYESVTLVVHGIKSIPELFVYGKPASSVVALGSRNLNIYAINDVMSRHGWHLNALQNPPAVHIACTMLTTTRTITMLLHDLADSVEEIKSHPLTSLNSGTAGIYGTSAALPDKSIIEDVAKGYIDVLYK